MAGSGTSNVQAFDVVSMDEGSQFGGGVIRGYACGIDQAKWFSIFFGGLERLGGAAGYGAIIDDECSIGIDYIHACSFMVATLRYLL